MKITKRNKRIKRPSRDQLNSNLFFRDEFHLLPGADLISSCHEELRRSYPAKRYIAKQELITPKKGKPKLVGRLFHEDGTPVAKVPKKFFPRQYLKKSN